MIASAILGTLTGLLAAALITWYRDRPRPRKLSEWTLYE